MSTNNTGKTGTHRATTREIVRFRVTVTLKVLFPLSWLATRFMEIQRATRASN